MSGKTGRQTFCLDTAPFIIAGGSTVGSFEGDGPLRDSFDVVSGDTLFGKDTWERAESAMVKDTLALTLAKAGCAPGDIDCCFAGDLLNQCVGTTFGLRESKIPMFGVYGACSTMAEALSLAAITVDSGLALKAAAVTCSHFCSAERQFRMPIEYGGQRTPTAQRTVTGCGCAILSSSGGGPRITHITPGRIVDAGITDANNMGAAMAPAAYDTLKAHLEDTGRSPDYYDLILTGDLGAVGSDILCDFFRNDGVSLNNHSDCGLIIFDRDRQDVHAGGSGAGCCASVFCGHILRGLNSGVWHNILFAATGALLSPTTTLQGESIPAICSAVALSA